MKLNKILDCDVDVDITGISEDSRNVKPGYLFVATKGFNVDHFDFAADAISKGAVAIVCDRKAHFSVPTIVVSDINQALIDACENFYDVKTSEFNFIGITGTDGKTTVASLIKQLLDDSRPIAYIGTNGMSVVGEKYSTSNTTPCVCELYSLFSIIKKSNCKDIVMEASSEALLHGRVNSIKYDIAIYTNITEDHLNIHKTIENYINSKLKLCDLVKEDGIILVNGDDDNCKVITDSRKRTYGFSSDNYYVIRNVQYMSNFVKFDLACKEFTYTVESPLIGKFNIYNAALVLIVGLIKNVAEDILLDRIKHFKPIDGRMEKLNFGQDYTIILDYAHTYNGIKSVLDCFNNVHRVILVTGAAGGREKEKRSKIGTLILSRADYVIFTMDDPRYEKVEDIVSEMIGENKSTNYETIIDRKSAIYRSFDMAKSGDVVLILGKGRDNYMAIEDKKLPYCDYDVIKSYFE